jgi:uncharacterized protein YecE (DUF72 family)
VVAVTGEVRIGISGWRYPPWRGVFYPKRLPQRDELRYAAEQLNTIEINGSFYSLQRPQSYRSWYEQTPDGFVFSAKGSRFVTHLKRLRDVGTVLPNFFASGLLALREKLGPLLWQLPPNMAFDADVLGAFLANLPVTTAEAAYLARHHDERLAGRAWTGTDADRPLRHAVEVRHPSFETPRFAELLREHCVAGVLADSGGRWPTIRDATADFCYVRLHGAEELYASGYDEPALREWAARIRAFAPRDIYVYFDNDAKVRAPFDAMALAGLLAAPSHPAPTQAP